MRSQLLALSLAVMALSACATKSGLKSGTPTPLAPSIVSGPITNIGQYELARKAARDQARKFFVSLSGKPRLTLAVTRLQQLTSTPSYTYALHLADTLRKYNIDIPTQPTSPTSTSITYEELATSAALTELLLNTPFDASGTKTQKSVPAEYLIPDELFHDVLRVIATDAPGDDAAFAGLSIFFNGKPEDVAPSPEKGKKEWMRDFLRLFPLCMARYVSPNRPLNLTSLPFFNESKGTGFSMFVGAYSNAQKGRVDWSHLTPQARNLGFALIRSAQRALAIDQSPIAQKRLHAFIEDASEKLTPVR